MIIPPRICARDSSPEQINDYRKKWNVPDWAEEQEYNYVKDLKDDRLRWEFLRRDEKYRQMSERKPRAHFILGNYIQPNIRGNELPENFLFADSKRQGGGLALILPPVKSLFFKKEEPDPQAPQGPIDAYFGAQIRELWEMGYVIVALDPLRPFDPQKNAAQKLYKEAREEVKEQTPELLSTTGSKRKIKLKYEVKLLQILGSINK
jgi:hypothetical protein